jgi:hypothetical protein
MPGSALYTGSVNVQFTLPDPTPKQDLADVVQVTVLGPIADNE